MRLILIFLLCLFGLVCPGGSQADTLPISYTPAFGNPHGDLVIMEFYDYRCVYCKASEEGLEKLLQEDKNLMIVYKDVPKIGPLSTTAAVATLASLKQGTDKYLALHRILMNRNFILSGEDKLYQTAASVGIDVDRLKKDMIDPAIERQIEANLELGKSLGAIRTPTFFIGKNTYVGYASYKQLKQMVDYERGLEKRGK